MKDFKRTARIGKTEYGYTWLEITWVEHLANSHGQGRLSITGVEGPRRNGNASGSCGQIIMSVKPADFESFSEGFDLDTVTRIWDIWDRWHLNDMRAGSPAQEDWLRAHPIRVTYPESHYEKASKALKGAGLNPDPNFLYSSKREPCDTCGKSWREHPYDIDSRKAVSDHEFTNEYPYPYGHGWIIEEVPEDVLEFLASLPDQRDEYPWA